MKTDDEISSARTRAHQEEAAFAEFLRGFDLSVTALSRGFRASLTDIQQYAHDVDLNVAGYACQYKCRGNVQLGRIVRNYWGPFVDEKVKADRTPVDFYILDFQDATIVVPYEPTLWKVQTSDDRSDRARGKQFYVVNVRDCTPLLAWIDWLRT